jgi:ferric-dicitrate binding protein FerR (iron transport regulator)
MSKQELTSLLQKYFSREITPAEKQALATLIAQTASEETIKESIEDIWNQYEPQEQLTNADSEDYYHRILLQIKSQQQQASVPAVHRVRFLRRSWMQMAAAAVLIIIAGAVLYVSLSHISRKKQQAQAVPVPATGTPLIRHITLPDGSIVMLQPNSTLDFPATFSGATREVTLQGEAFFDVVHLAAQPFIIHSGKIKTTVLGTAFNIKAWPQEKEITITVTRGKVKVENETHLLGIITPNQQISFNSQNESSKQLTVDTATIISWKKSTYAMDNLTLDEAITEIQVRYGIIILVKGEPAGDCRFTASFKQDESLDYVLNVICKIYNASWKKENGTIIIDHVQCK